MPTENEVRVAVTNGNLPVGERRNAATILVKLLLAGVPEPSDDDDEVEKLRQPWPRNTPDEVCMADMTMKALEELGMKDYTHGRTVEEARLVVLNKRKRARLVEIAADPKEASLVRDVAALELGGPAIRRA